MAGSPEQSGEILFWEIDCALLFLFFYPFIYYYYYYLDYFCLYIIYIYYITALLIFFKAVAMTR